jgi:hypothetical protein
MGSAGTAPRTQARRVDLRNDAEQMGVCRPCSVAGAQRNSHARPVACTAGPPRRGHFSDEVPPQPPIGRQTLLWPYRGRFPLQHIRCAVLPLWKLIYNANAAGCA